MSDTRQAQGRYRIDDATVWNVTRMTFFIASLIFLVTITLGFLNIVTAGALPRWQVLTHLHSGTLGWILLSYIGIVIWLFTGTRKVRTSYGQRCTWLVLLASIAFIGVIGSFAYGYSQPGGGSMVPLGVFAPLAAAMVWVTAIFALTQLRRLPVVTTPHLLVAVGMTIAAIGVSFGAWIGLGHAFGTPLPIPSDMGIGAHILTVIPGLTVVATGVIEWLTAPGDATQWTKSGALQAGIGGFAGLMLPMGATLLALGVPEETAGIVFLGLIAGAILYTLVFLARLGRRTLLTNPLNGGIDAWMFFATVWFLVFVGFELAGPTLGEADWIMVLTVHSFFVGLLTNLLLGVISVRTQRVPPRYSWTEPTAMWLLNAGIVLFVALEAVMTVSHGATIMGIGVLLGVGTMLRRLQDGSVNAVESAEENVA